LNNHQNSFQVFKYFIVPKTYHFKAIEIEKTVPVFIYLPVCGVLPTIQFDYQFSFKTDKIDDIRINRLLSPEITIFDLPVPELLPEFAFCFGTAAS